MKMFPEPLPGSLYRQFFDWDFNATIEHGRSAHQKYIHRLQHFPAAKGWGRTSSKEETLVDIMMQDKSKTIMIKTTKATAEVFGQIIADSIRVSQALAFNHFHRID
jgi:hypothetical protein